MTLNENNWVAKYIDWFCIDYLDCLKNVEKRLLSHIHKDSSNCVINVGKKWTLQMLIPQSLVLVLKLNPINTVSLNAVFSIPQNQCYLGPPCTFLLWKLFG